MKRILVLLSLGLMLAVTTRFAGAQQPGNTPRFTGKSEVMDGKDLTAARRHFDAGARTAWHSHDNGQLLLVEKGRMRVQKRGEPVRELGVGASDYAGPNVEHWHGAAANEALVQINVGFGGGSKWFADVTDAEYMGR
jgi:quercetin dioxygenase-like cupin family protein